MIPQDCRFLILEDMENIRSLLKNHLKLMGFTVPPFEAGTVKKALEVLETGIQIKLPIQFIISDYNLPDDTGQKFLKIIRDDPRFEELPFIFLTIESSMDKIVEAADLGCTNYLVKPWEKEELKEKIVESWNFHHQETGPLIQVPDKELRKKKKKKDKKKGKKKD